MEEFLLYTDKTEGLIGFITLPPSTNKTPNAEESHKNEAAENSSIPIGSRDDVGGTPHVVSPAYHKHILSRSPAPVAVGYDPVEEVVYWSDVQDCTINRIKLKNGTKEVFMNMSDGIGTVDGKRNSSVLLDTNPFQISISKSYLITPCKT